MDRPREDWARRDSGTGKDLPAPEWRTRGIFAARKILIHKNVDPFAARPLRAFIDDGHYPSDNFHFAWLDPNLRGAGPWTYEALLAFLNAPVSQVCLALARTRNNPTDLIESIRIPRVDRKSLEMITAQVSAILRLDVSDGEARKELLAALDKQILAMYPLTEWERELFWQTVWGDTSQTSRPPGLTKRGPYTV